MESIYGMWPWYVSGPLISLIMLALLLAGKNLGMSANLRTLCSAGGAGRWSDFFCFDWKSQRWNLVVLLGAVVGGFLGSNFLTDDPKVEISEESQAALVQMGFSQPEGYLPDELFGAEALATPGTIAILILGGLLIGFGTRYAGGCTSGHAISGLSNLQIPSLIAVAGFFIGGLIMTHFLLPLLF